MNYTAKELKCSCAVNTIVVAGTYYVSDETVRRVDDYQMLDTYLRPKAQNFKHNTRFHEEVASQTLKALSLLFCLNNSA